MGRLSTQVQNPAMERPAGGPVFNQWHWGEALGPISPHQTHQESGTAIAALKKCKCTFRSILAATLLALRPSEEKGEFRHA